MIGIDYLADHIQSAMAAESKDYRYRVYVTDALMVISKRGHMTARWAEKNPLYNPVTAEKSAEEIACDLMGQINKIMGVDNEPF